MTTKTITKTVREDGYILNYVYEGTYLDGFNDYGETVRFFVPTCFAFGYYSCPVTKLRLQEIDQHKTLRSYAATAKRAIGVGYDGDMPHADNPMVIIQNLKNEWYAIRLKGYELEISPIKGDLDPYYDIGDGWEGQPFDKEKIWGWRWLTVNQSQSTNKRLLSIVDWLLMR